MYACMMDQSEDMSCSCREESSKLSLHSMQLFQISCCSCPVGYCFHFTAADSSPPVDISGGCCKIHQIDNAQFSGQSITGGRRYCAQIGYYWMPLLSSCPRYVAFNSQLYFFVESILLRIEK